MTRGRCVPIADRLQAISRAAVVSSCCADFQNLIQRKKRDVRSLGRSPGIRSSVVRRSRTFKESTVIKGCAPCIHALPRRRAKSSQEKVNASKQGGSRGLICELNPSGVPPRALGRESRVAFSPARFVIALSTRGSSDRLGRSLLDGMKWWAYWSGWVW